MGKPKLDDKAIADLTEDAINAICKIVQDKIGVTDGGYASQYFSNDEERAPVEDVIRRYLAAEQRGAEEEAGR